jgi:uncharacterized RDD family membrane protein YckC
MRCPKCHYISFGSADRCRNCGYEFVLASDSPPPLDLRLDGGAQASGPLADFALSEQPPAPASPFAGAHAADATASRRPSTGSRLDLPLFGDDAPLVTPSAVPRAPLSVRRGQPALARPRADRAAAAADEQDRAVDRSSPRVIRLEDGKPLELPPRPATVDASAAEPLRAASSLARMMAGLVDILVLATLDAGVLYSTLRLVDLPVERIGVIPIVPMGLFLVLLNGGYLAIFTTAGGQTIGKMLARIKVVADPSPESIDADGPLRQVPLGASVLRATAYLASLLPAGLGFAAILFDSDGRALHDRLAETRVVEDRSIRVP